VVIEAVTPEIDGGRFPIKRIIGDELVVEADIFADSHDVLSAVMLYRWEGDSKWTEVPMKFLVNDRWRGTFKVTKLGHYYYTITAWVDHFKSWQQALAKKFKAKQDVSVELLVGVQLISEASQRATASNSSVMGEWAKSLQARQTPQSAKVRLALSQKVARLMDKYSDRRFATKYHRELAVLVDRERARFSTWYEMFPRSCSTRDGVHGTFKDCEQRLPYIAAMGFDVLYFPPIHPIGHTNRKGKNNAPTAGSNEPGTPWAIGSEEGGHKAIYSKLGTVDDFRKLVTKAREYGIELALDIAFQCTPDHPYVKEHPEWFRWRPDNTIQYAENPPKKYQDIYPLNFDTDNWQELWKELKDVVLYWVKQGFHILRVDNPHTKPFQFWEWLIAEVKKDHLDVIFLAEAFTRPKVMYQLAKLGFSQSYTYFTWRNTSWEFTQYFTELTQTEVREYFRPNLWTNTPDILTEYLQTGGEPAFKVRLVLAATLGASYGIYGPTFELMENLPKEKGSEEYLNSEKYEIKHWNIDRPDSLKDFIAGVNSIRRENVALQSDLSLRFHPTDNEQLLCYSKHTVDHSNVILVIVNMDPKNKQAGWIELNLDGLGLEPDRPFEVQDLLNDVSYQWRGPRSYVELNPKKTPAHIFRVNRHIHQEQDLNAKIHKRI